MGSNGKFFILRKQWPFKELTVSMVMTLLKNIMELI